MDRTHLFQNWRMTNSCSLSGIEHVMFDFYPLLFLFALSEAQLTVYKDCQKCSILIFSPQMIKLFSQIYLSTISAPRYLMRPTVSKIFRLVACISFSFVYRFEYPVRTPLVRFLFCLMAILMILWDFMLLITVLYYHKTIEKGKRCQCWSWHHSYSRFTSSGECVCGSGLVYSLQDHLQGKYFFRFAGRRNIWKRHLERSGQY